MYIIFNRTIIQRSIVFKRMLFMLESKKDTGSRSYYNTVTVEYPDEQGKFIYYLMPSYRLPSWSKVLKQYYCRRYPISSKIMLNKNLPDIIEFLKQNNLR